MWLPSTSPPYFTLGSLHFRFPPLSPSIFPAFATHDNIYDAYTAATQDVIIIVWGGCIIATVAPLSCWLNGVAMQPLSPHHPITGRLGTCHAFSEIDAIILWFNMPSMFAFSALTLLIGRQEGHAAC